MFDWLVPDLLFRIFVWLSAGLGFLGWRRVVLALLCGLFLWATARLLRALGLRLDLMLAERARASGGVPGSGVFAIGRGALWLPRLALAVAAVAVLAETVLAAVNQRLLPGDAPSRALGEIARGISQFLW